MRDLNPRRWWRLSTLALALITAAVMAQSRIDADTIARGRALYLELRCGVCHHLDGAGATGVFAPPHDALAVVAEARIQDPRYRGAARTAAEYVRESIVDPQAYLVPGYALTRLPMPAFRDLADDDLEALVAFLLAPATP